LSELPLDILKIDKSFIDRVAHQEELIRAIIELGRSMGLKVIAEGIETGRQLALLRSLNCDAGQGYFLGRPLERTAVEHFLRQPVAWSEAA
jgi:EAL domain-containing protein (putative c-di-GMP-specific phosphodiesterase class I)